MEILLPAATLTYLGLIFALALFAKKKIRDETDFMAAGRRLSTFFASATLFATWFGAGTLLTATDAIYSDGLKTMALEPYGAGSCLLLAGLFFAKPLWRMKILTIPDFFQITFGKKAEKLATILMVPGYFGWIAVQIAALSGIIHIFFGLSIPLAMIIITIIATTFTWLGGMWSVTLTDSAQMILVCCVLCVLAYTVLEALGNGHLTAGINQWLQNAQINTELDHLRQNGRALFSCLNVFVIAALGNLPGQDLAQRIFSAKSEKTAQRSCLIAGIFYVSLGSISILLGIAARSLLPEQIDHSVIPLLAKHLLSPGLTVLLILAIISIVLSTIDSAMLATSSIIAHNLLRGRISSSRYSLVSVCRMCTIFVGVCSLLLAFVGENTYLLLEQSYAISLVGLFVPFALGLYFKKAHEGAAIVSMLVGMTVWLLGFFFEMFLASELFALAASFIAYVIVAFLAGQAQGRFKIPLRKRGQEDFVRPVT